MSETNETELVSKMRRAYRTGTAGEIEEVESVEASKVDSETPIEGIAQIDDIDELPRVERQIVELTEDFLDREDVTDRQMRREVLKVIVETRFGDQLSDERRADVIQTLTSTLGEDLQFQGTIDRAIVQAASKLGD
jgi:hypothetical protein